MHFIDNNSLQNISLHYVGNKGEDGRLSFSKGSFTLEEGIKEIFGSYLLSPFKSDEYYRLYHDVEISLNEVYAYVSAIFEDPANLHEQSVNIARHLYNQSTHPKIKGGEFYVVYFKDCMVNGETADAVGLFKSENKDIFLKIHPQGDHFEIETDEGININKLDKGCLIFNREKEDGYVVAVVDNTNKGSEAQYWMDDFLHVRQKQDTYFNTANTLSVYKDFVRKKLPEEYEMGKADQADFLNRSIQFFKDNEKFELQQFNEEVLHYPEYIEGFNRYKQQYEKEADVELADEFTISDTAVKQQSRYYKSVIKLDKNFHIYVHGNRELIEQGVDEAGRKFYKIYYTNET